jgi:hypothetical protein
MFEAAEAGLPKSPELRQQLCPPAALCCPGPPQEGKYHQWLEGLAVMLQHYYTVIGQLTPIEKQLLVKWVLLLARPYPALAASRPACCLPAPRLLLPPGLPVGLPAPRHWLPPSLPVLCCRPFLCLHAAAPMVVNRPGRWLPGQLPSCLGGLECLPSCCLMQEAGGAGGVAAAWLQHLQLELVGHS